MSEQENRGQKMYAWIKAQHEAGRTVYVHTYTRTTRLAPKHAHMVRLSGNHCEMQAGKRWDSLNFCSLSAS